MSDTNTDPNSPQMAGCQQEPCSGSSLLEWLDDHACELVAESYPIADTGDYDGAWVVYDEPSPVNSINRSSKPRQPMGWGRTPAEAIRDAMKGPDDPTKYDYVPPEFRSQNAKLSNEEGGKERL